MGDNVVVLVIRKATTTTAAAATMVVVVTGPRYPPLHILFATGDRQLELLQRSEYLHGIAHSGLFSEILDEFVQLSIQNIRRAVDLLRDIAENYEVIFEIYTELRCENFRSRLWIDRHRRR